MTLQTMSSMQFVPERESELISYNTPPRVFVLSNRRLLRDALARLLKNQGGISLVRAEKLSISAIAEIIDSRYNTLLIDPLNTSVLYKSIVHQLAIALPLLRVISIDMETNIDDLLSKVFATSSICEN